jgi:hypothetical protein
MRWRQYPTTVIPHAFYLDKRKIRRYPQPTNFCKKAHLFFCKTIAANRSFVIGKRAKVQMRELVLGDFADGFFNPFKNVVFPFRFNQYGRKNQPLGRTGRSLSLDLFNAVVSGLIDICYVSDRRHA